MNRIICFLFVQQADEAGDGAQAVKGLRADSSPGTSTKPSRLQKGSGPEIMGWGCIVGLRAWPLGYIDWCGSPDGSFGGVSVLVSVSEGIEMP